jgi:signal transduction histidine kinase
VLRSLARLGTAAARLPVLLVDGLLALALLAATTSVGHDWTVPNRHEFDLRGILLSAAVLLPLTFRRRYPLTVFGFSSATYAWYLAVGYATTLDFYGPLLAFATISMVARTRTSAYACLLVAGLMFAGGLTTPNSPVLGSLFEAVIAPGLAWGLGASIRGLSLRNRRLAELTTQLEGAQELIAQRAALDERVRIARELHDAAAHHISVIGVQAELAHYVFDSDPDQARESLGLIAAASRDAVGEMRNLLTVLRPETLAPQDSELEYTPALSLDRLLELIERARATGVPVATEISGERRSLTPAADACAYRIVQEALTNVAKHAPGATTRVHLAYERSGLRISVLNDTPPHRDPPSPDTAAALLPDQLRRGGAGLGLIGMRERAAICGAELAAGPRPGGGYSVILMLPLSPEVDWPKAARISSGP